MFSLHRTALVAPLLLLACSLEINGSDVTTDPSTSEPETSSPTTPTTVPTTVQPTSEGPTTDDLPTTGTATDTTTGDTDATDTDTTGIDTEGDTDTGEETPCMMSGECMEGQVCWAPYTDWMGEFSCQAECVGDMGKGNSADVWCADDAACCNADATCSNMGYCVPGQEPDTDTDTDTGGSSSGTDTDTDTGSTGASSTSGDTENDTEFGVLPNIDLEGFTVTANCMPQVPADPVSAKWTATFENTTGVDITANVTGASLTYNPGPQEFVQDISVSPTSSGVVMPS